MLKDKIKEVRQEKGLTQSEVALAINRQKYNVGNWEQGRAEPSTDDLIKLAKLFNVSVDYLLGLEDDFGVKQYEEKSVSALTWDKKELLDLYDLLPEERKEMLRYTAKDYVDICKQRGLINSNKVSYKK